MASLWQRLIGDLTDADIAAGDTKIGIHAFMAYAKEWARGAGNTDGGATVFDKQGLKDKFGLTTSQSNQLDVLLGLRAAASDKQEFDAIFKDCAYLAESGTAYMNQVDVQSRLTGL